MTVRHSGHVRLSLLGFSRTIVSMHDRHVEVCPQLGSTYRCSSGSRQMLHSFFAACAGCVATNAGDAASAGVGAGAGAGSPSAVRSMNAADEVEGVDMAGSGAACRGRLPARLCECSAGRFPPAIRGGGAAGGSLSHSIPSLSLSISCSYLSGAAASCSTSLFSLSCCIRLPITDFTTSICSSTGTEGAKSNRLCAPPFASHACS